MWKVSLTPKKKRNRGLSVQWSKEEKALLVSLKKSGAEFVEIAAAVGLLNAERAGVGGMLPKPNRTPKSVAIQCVKLKLISREECDEWICEYEKSVGRDRAKNLYKTRVLVLERDGKECICCRKSETLEFCHVIPFFKTRENLEREAVTLCRFHHRSFDRGVEPVVKRVYKYLCSSYTDYREYYALHSLPRGRLQIIRLK